ncbi:hypothetical protein LCGC14_0816060 [marine sediment metagenome]|uniref:Uncharacterized protein n=1 Tax=marine sediment metagenome TaxID=412755 RepID=A0A0F9SSM8_9ZZZZ
MSGTTNIIRGIIFTIIYIITTILVPFFIFRWVMNFQVAIPPDGEIAIEMTQESYDRIIFWIIAFGLLISGCAFFSYSSPKQSIRRGVFALIQVIVNCLYLWSYKFSGATEVRFNIDIPAFSGFVMLNLEQMILIYLGIYFLTIVIKSYDIIDFIINRKKIRENRMKE